MGRRKIGTRYDRSEFKTGGGIMQLVDGLPIDIQDWVVDNIPPGGTLTELIRAVIVDAYNDEMEEKACESPD